MSGPLVSRLSHSLVGCAWRVISSVIVNVSCEFDKSVRYLYVYTLLFTRCVIRCPSSLFFALSLRKVSSVTAWAEKTGAGGGRRKGRTLASPVKVEFVTEDGWDAPGMNRNAEGQAAHQRLRIPLLEVR